MMMITSSSSSSLFISISSLEFKRRFEQQKCLKSVFARENPIVKSEGSFLLDTIFIFDFVVFSVS